MAPHMPARPIGISTASEKASYSIVSVIQRQVNKSNTCQHKELLVVFSYLFDERARSEPIDSFPCIINVKVLSIKDSFAATSGFEADIYRHFGLSLHPSLLACQHHLAKEIQSNRHQLSQDRHMNLFPQEGLCQSCLYERLPMESPSARLPIESPSTGRQGASVTRCTAPDLMPVEPTLPP